MQFLDQLVSCNLLDYIIKGCTLQSDKNVQTFPVNDGIYKELFISAHEAVRILKVLRNPKAAYAKKRQYMRATFGDYRQKMDAETKRYAVSK